MDETLPVAGTTVLLRDAPHGVEVLLIRRPDRGSFAGGWVFPGGLIEELDRRHGDIEEADARRAAIRESVEEVGLRPTGLVTLSRWVPPNEAPKRVRTWFFLGLDPGNDVTPSAAEVVDWRWLRPADALAAHAERELELFPPTWLTLHGLVAAASAAVALDAVREPRFFSTVMLSGDTGATFVWEGDVAHRDGSSNPEARHRLETGMRPWRYIRR